LTQLTKTLANVDSEFNVEELRNTAKQVTDSIRNYNNSYKDTRSKSPSVYREGDYVLIRDLRTKPGESSKLKLRIRVHTLKNT